MIYALENVEALWPKLDRAYKFDPAQNRSVATEVTDTEGSYEVSVVLNEADAKALAGAMRKEFNAQRKDDWKDWQPKSLDDVFKKDETGHYIAKITKLAPYRYNGAGISRAQRQQGRQPVCQ